MRNSKNKNERRYDCKYILHLLVQKTDHHLALISYIPTTTITTTTTTTTTTTNKYPINDNNVENKMVRCKLFPFNSRYIYDFIIEESLNHVKK